MIVRNPLMFSHKAKMIKVKAIETSVHQRFTGMRCRDFVA